MLMLNGGIANVLSTAASSWSTISTPDFWPTVKPAAREIAWKPLR
jgi:hypothetical protein